MGDGKGVVGLYLGMNGLIIFFFLKIPRVVGAVAAGLFWDWNKDGVLTGIGEAEEVTTPALLPGKTFFFFRNTFLAK